MRKMHKKPFVPKPDTHGHLLTSECDYDELAQMFLCSVPVVRYFKKAGILPVKRIANKKMAFDREEAKRVLSPYVIDGRLTLAKPKQ